MNELITGKTKNFFTTDEGPLCLQYIQILSSVYCFLSIYLSFGKQFLHGERGIHTTQ